MRQIVMTLPKMRRILNLNKDPWRDIPIASVGNFSRRRVNDEVSHNLFWFRDDRNRVGFLAEIPEKLTSKELEKAKINIRDIFVDVIEVSKENLKVLIIRLEEDANRDVFLKLCFDLIDRVMSSNKSDPIFQTIYQRLKKWQALLSESGKNILSLQERQGLYAELYFMTEILQKDSKYESLLIKGWEGPEKGQQDFILENSAIEIKSIAGNQRGKIKISSEDQLETHLDNLFLRVYFLSEDQNKDRAESLNDIVSRISLLLTNKKNKELFEIKLESAGYIDISEYDSPLFHINSRSTYLVTEGFPRITRKIVPLGIESVSYDLILACIEKYKTTSEIMEG